MSSISLHRTIAKGFTIDQLKYTRYDFRKGGGIPSHQHTENDAHITIVTTGSIVVRRPGVPDLVMKPGEACHFEPGCEHEIEGLEDGTRIYNIQVRYATPAGDV